MFHHGLTARISECQYNSWGKSNEEIPAVGFSIGFERIFGILTENGSLIPDSKKKIALFFDKETQIQALLKAEELRNDYIVSAMLRPKKLGKYLSKLEAADFDGFIVYGQDDEIKYFNS